MLPPEAIIRPVLTFHPETLAFAAKHLHRLFGDTSAALTMQRASESVARDLP
jgi:hypothetical protein